MTATVTRLSGDEWQQWANKLLVAHYGHTEYQEVPDRDSGDAGIEGFTRTDGHAYQVFGCEEPISTSERYEKQRDKMTEDIRKFQQNQAILQRLFGTTRITRWILFVPVFDSKQIVTHATKKTAEVLAANLAYVGTPFQVTVCHEEHFAVEREALINSGIRTLQLDVSTPSTEQIEAWSSSHQPLANTLEAKLRRLPRLTTDAQVAAFKTSVFSWFLKGEDILEALRKHPDLYQKAVKAKSHREEFLALAQITDSSPSQVFSHVIAEVQSTFKDQLKDLESIRVESLVYEALADWLLRCPLDFPEPV